MRGDYAKESGSSVDTHDVPYDYGSIMHYDAYRLCSLQIMVQSTSWTFIEKGFFLFSNAIDKKKPTIMPKDEK